MFEINVTCLWGKCVDSNTIHNANGTTSLGLGSGISYKPCHQEDILLG